MQRDRTSLGWICTKAEAGAATDADAIHKKSEESESRSANTAAAAAVLNYRLTGHLFVLTVAPRTNSSDVSSMINTAPSRSNSLTGGGSTAEQGAR